MSAFEKLVRDEQQKVIEPTLNDDEKIISNKFNLVNECYYQICFYRPRIK